MDLLFGEVNEPTTRAFWDEYDSEDPIENREIEAIINEIVPNPSRRYKCAIIVEGGVAVYDFLNRTLINGKSASFHFKSCPLKLYDMPDEDFCLIMCSERELNHFSIISAKLKKWLENADIVYTLTIQPAVVFKGDPGPIDETGCFLRSLNLSSSAIAAPEVKTLEPPNILSGLSACILSWRLINKLPVVSFIAYMDSQIFDSITVRPLLRLFSDLKIGKVGKFAYKYPSDTSNLYL